MMHLVVLLLALLLVHPVKSGLSLLGVRSGSKSSGSGESKQDSGPPASFQVDTSNAALTKLKGKAIHFDVDSLEVSALDGLFRLSGSHAHFEKGRSTWKTTVEESTVAYYHNNRNLVHLDVSDGSIDQSKLKFAGEMVLSDVWISDRDKLRAIMTSLCRADRTLTPLPAGVLDAEANAAAVEKCAEDVADTQLSLSSIQDYASKLLMMSAALRAKDSAALQQLQSLAANLTSSGPKDAGEEKERVRAIMTEFEAVVDALRLELTGRVKAVKGSFDTLREEWGAVDGRFDLLDANFSSKLNETIAPLQEALLAVQTTVEAVQTALNTSVTQQLQEVRDATAAQGLALSASVEEVRGEVVLLNASAQARVDNLNASVVSVAQEVQGLERRLLDALANASQATTEAWQQGLQASTLQLEELAANATDNRRLFSAVKAQLATQNSSISELSAALQEQILDARNLSLALAEVRTETAEAINASTAALQADMIAEFTHSRRESAAAVAEVNATVTAAAQNASDALLALRAEISANLTASTTGTSAYVDEVAAALRLQLENSTAEARLGVEQFTALVSSTAAQLQAQAENATLSYYNTSMAAIAELTANTSQVVARSNSILARAIGEVNSTLLSVNASLTEMLADSIAQVESRASQALEAALKRVDADLAASVAGSAESVQEAESRLNGSLAELGAALNRNLTAADEFTRSELTRLAEERLSDKLAAENASAALLHDMTAEIASKELALSARVTVLNESTTKLVTALAGELTVAQANISHALQAHAEAATVALAANITAVTTQLMSELQHVEGALTEQIDAKSDKLRYSLMSMNTSFLSARSEDQNSTSAQVEALRAHIEAAHGALNASQLLAAAALEKVNATAAAAVASLNNTIADGLTQVNMRLLAAAAQQSDDLNCTAANLTAQVAAVEARRGADVLQASVQLSALNVTLLGEVQRAAAQAADADRKFAQESQDALAAESLRLQKQISEGLSSVASAANTSLTAAAADLRQHVSNTVAAVVAAHAAESDRVSKALNETSRLILTNRAEATAALSKVALEANANNTALSVLAAAQNKEHTAAAAALEASITRVEADASKALLSATAELRANITSAGAAARASEGMLLGRINDTDSAVSKVARDAATQAAALAAQLTALSSAANASLLAQWEKTQKLQGDLAAQAYKNISALQKALTDTVDANKAAAKADLDRETAAVSKRLETALTAGLSKENSDRAAAVKALNTSISAEATSRAASHSALSAQILELTAKHTAYSTSTDTAFAEHTQKIRANADAVAKQDARLAAALGNFTAQQTARDAQVLQQVEARVHEAEVQQRLGAVALEAVRNDTARLSQSVDASTTRLSAMEVSAATLRAEAAQLREEQEKLRSTQGNMSAAALPSIFTQLGSLQQLTTQLQGNAKQARDESLTFRESTAREAQRLDSTQRQLEDSVRTVVDDLRDSKTASTASLTQLQQQYVSVAVRANSTAAEVELLSAALKTAAADAHLVHAHHAQLAETQRKMQAQDQQVASLTESVELLKTTTASATKALQETVEAQAVQIRALEAARVEQQAALQELREENRRLVRESATVQSTDELRKLLFELQAQMLGHSSKVLDLLLQPRSAVLVHNPCTGTGTPCSAATATTVQEGTPAEAPVHSG